MGEKTEANEREEAEAVTTILPEEVRCPACGKSSTAFILRSWSSFNDGPLFELRNRVECVWCRREFPVDGAIEFLDDDDALEHDPRFEEETEALEEGETEVIFGKWIPGAQRPKESGE